MFRCLNIVAIVAFPSPVPGDKVLTRRKRSNTGLLDGSTATTFEPIMKKLLTPLLAALLLTDGAIAAADSAVDLTVKGRITPSACQPAITNGGAIDHGKLSAKDLNIETLTILPEYRLQLSIRCEGPTLLALNTVDNRAGSALEPSLHGLGLVNGSEKLGNLTFSLADPVSESGSMRPIVSSNNGATWMSGSHLTHGLLTAVTSMGSPASVPTAFTTLDATLVFYTQIAPANTLTLTQEVPLDGHATLQVKYL